MVTFVTNDFFVGRFGVCKMLLLLTVCTNDELKSLERCAKG